MEITLNEFPWAICHSLSGLEDSKEKCRRLLKNVLKYCNNRYLSIFFMQDYAG